MIDITLACTLFIDARSAVGSAILFVGFLILVCLGILRIRARFGPENRVTKTINLLLFLAFFANLSVGPIYFTSLHTELCAEDKELKNDNFG